MPDSSNHAATPAQLTPERIGEIDAMLESVSRSENAYREGWPLAVRQLRAEVRRLEAEVADLRARLSKQVEQREWAEQCEKDARAEVEKLRAEVKVDDQIITERNRLLDMFECKAHGKGCVPHAMEEVERLRVAERETLAGRVDCERRRRAGRHEEDVMDVADRVARQIEADICDRRGLRHEYEQFDEEIRAKILRAWAEIIRAALKSEVEAIVRIIDAMAVRQGEVESNWDDAGDREHSARAEHARHMLEDAAAAVRATKRGEDSEGDPRTPSCGVGGAGGE